MIRIPRIFPVLLGLLVLHVRSQAAEEVYQVLDPGKSEFLVESAHFVARWNAKDNVKLNDAEVKTGLATLERIREFYLGKVGFVPPYQGEKDKYKSTA